ncbi:endonuclease [Bifidobacterium jacchi]|uniref:Endonuclease n=2 Tax=Bifidobacterium jacchi TaxID=2490545 RepID=A0A5N5RE62_9BIFI|nr:endonuclease [Bifidobacterium jacchi]
MPQPSAAFAQPLGAHSTAAQPAAAAQPVPTRSGGNFVINWFVKPGKHGVLSSLLWLMTIPCVAVMALRVAPNVDQDGRLLPEIIAFVPVLGIVSVVVLLFALLWRRKLLTAVSLACVVIQVMWHIGFFMPTVHISDSARQTVAAAAKTDDKAARLMTLNTKEGNASASDIVRTVRDEHVEVLALQEVSDELLGELRSAGLYDVLPYSIVSAPSANDNGGLNGVWTMAPMSNASQSLLPVETSQMPAGTISIGGKLVRFVSAHPNSPTRGLQSLWSEGLNTIGDLKNYQWTYVVMGDFNSTWDHPRFRALLGDRFVDAGEQAGQGFHFTYPSGSRIPPLIEIDHIIHDKGVTVADLATVEISGSDHRALLATLEVS